MEGLSILSLEIPFFFLMDKKPFVYSTNRNNLASFSRARLSRLNHTRQRIFVEITNAKIPQVDARDDATIIKHS